MTRETKIGLLVGLAFIIVIGILLSDHLTVTAEPPQAALVQAGPSVRQGITVPGMSNASVAAQTPAPVNVVPQQAVLTAQDLRQPEQIDIRIGAAQTGVRPADSAQPAHVTNTVPPAQADAVALTQVPAEPLILPGHEVLPPELRQSELRLPGQADAAPLGSPLERVAREMGEQLEPVDRSGRPVPAGQSQQRAAENTVAAREYVAVAGDTLSKMASRFFGANTREHRDLIVRANPSLQANPNLVVAGRKYLIPERKITTTPASTGQLTSSLPAERTRSTERTTSIPYYTYTVKSGDTLWGIASTRLGGAGELATLKELNKDVLRGSDVVRVGMKLKLPAKAVSSAD